LLGAVLHRPCFQGVSYDPCSPTTEIGLQQEETQHTNPHDHRSVRALRPCSRCFCPSANFTYFAIAYIREEETASMPLLRRHQKTEGISVSQILVVVVRELASRSRRQEEACSN
ncbi:hypothetical protein JMJ77_0002799, partial [Colletotrichum scovillei]